MPARKQQKGQALIETSLVIITLLLTILGIMDFGQFLFFHQALTDRARVGARYAITNTYDATAIKNVVRFNTPTDPGTPGMFGLLDSHVTVTPTVSAGVTTRIEVMISNFPIQFLSPGLTHTYTHLPIRVVRQAEGMGATN